MRQFKFLQLLSFIKFVSLQFLRIERNRNWRFLYKKMKIQIHNAGGRIRNTTFFRKESCMHQRNYNCFALQSYLRMHKTAGCYFTLFNSKMPLPGSRNTNFLEKSFYEFKNYNWIYNLVCRRHNPPDWCDFQSQMGTEGIEPPTQRASVVCSPTELPSLKI